MTTKTIKSTIPSPTELIIHYGLTSIPQTNFIVLTPSLAKEFRDAIDKWLEKC